MKVRYVLLAGLLCSAAILSLNNAVSAGGPGCASCAAGGAAVYAPAPQGPAFGQPSMPDWGPMPTSCCNRPQRDMCDWWAGYCGSQRITPCPADCGPCNYGQGGWGEGWLGPSLAAGCKRAGHHFGGCGGGCCGAPSCGSACCAPACPAPCDDCCGSGCGGGFGNMFGGMFGKGCHCTNVIGGSSGTAYCGCCPPQRCGKCPKPCCAAPCCPPPPCRSRLTYGGGCCNDGGGANLPLVNNQAVDSYYQDTGARTDESMIGDQSRGVESEPTPAPMRSPAPAFDVAPPTPALPAPRPRPSPEVLSPTSSLSLPLDVDIPALNDAGSNQDVNAESI